MSTWSKSLAFGAILVAMMASLGFDASFVRGEEKSGKGAETIARKGTVKIKSVSALSTKANGDAWDGGGNAPDLYVVVSDGSSKEKTASVRDSLLAKLDHTTSITVELGDQLSLEVWDEDIAFNDEVGKTTIVITRDALESGILKVSFGRVDNLILVLE